MGQLGAEALILYGGRRASASFLRRHVGYVEQFDTLLPALTGKGSLRTAVGYCLEAFSGHGKPVQVAGLELQHGSKVLAGLLFSLSATCLQCVRSWPAKYQPLRLHMHAVFDMLLYTAQLKLPRELPLASKVEEVEELIQK